MNSEDRSRLKYLVDQAARERAASGYMDCDPESLTRRAIEADAQGFTEIAQALRNFRDVVVNQLLGEGWSLDRIEQASINYFQKRA